MRRKPQLSVNVSPLIYSTNDMCRISINGVDIAGQALIYLPNPICKIYKLSNLYSQGERNKKSEGKAESG